MDGSRFIRNFWEMMAKMVVKSEMYIFHQDGGIPDHCVVSLI